MVTKKRIIPLRSPKPSPTRKCRQSLHIADAPPLASAPPTNPSFHPPTNPILGRRTRNGVVARLPKFERDLVNQMLQNGVPYENIVAALQDIGCHATQRNISNWKTRGGYREWCAEQERAVQNRIQQDNLVDFLRPEDGPQLPEVGLQLAAADLSRLLLDPAARQQLAADPLKYGRIVSALCRLSRELRKLQKDRDDAARALGEEHDPDKIRQENERQFDILMEVYGKREPLSSLPEEENVPEPPDPDPERLERKERFEFMRQVLAAAKAGRKTDPPSAAPAPELSPPPT